jgi:hypothetical protein
MFMCNNFQRTHYAENVAGSSGKEILHEQCCVEEQCKEWQKSV